MGCLRILCVLTVLSQIFWEIGAQTSGMNKALEDTLFKTYNRKHRPVKKESTTVGVQVYLSVTHVENVNENEQTMLVHGNLWTTWSDEYLTWEPKDWNGTTRLSVDAYKIWQPALSLYNSAKANQWYLYMHGMPAMVSSSGKIWATAAYSFQVTCLFNFRDWPFDEQECPIVIADWVYDLAKVNLSDPSGDKPWNKPAIRLNFDPVKKMEKKHVGGWEVYDSWRRHCYWGPGGCTQEVPSTNPEWYWSLLEFGVKLRRHSPYFVLTVLFPTIISCLITLASFWIETPAMAIGLIVFNMTLQGLFGWDLIRDLPPGSGGVPKIVVLYALNLALTGGALIAHAGSLWLLSILPHLYTIPMPKLTETFAKLSKKSLFRQKGLSFDPQMILNSEQEDTTTYDQPLPKVASGISIGSGLSDEEPATPRGESSDQLLDLGSTGPSTTDDHELSLEVEGAETSPGPSVAKSTSSPLLEQLFLVRRVIFCVFTLIYIIALPICTIPWF
ncbi:unnamed protein product, partial [Mesorhabditis spiculigera]